MNKKKGLRHSFYFRKFTHQFDDEKQQEGVYKYFQKLINDHEIRAVQKLRP